jgi:hypothetical protein
VARPDQEYDNPASQAGRVLATLRGMRAQWLLAPDAVDLASVTKEVVARVRRSIAT